VGLCPARAALEELGEHLAHELDDVLVPQLEAQAQQLLEGLNTLRCK
jgi:hypothetical protein